MNNAVSVGLTDSDRPRSAAERPRIEVRSRANSTTERPAAAVAPRKLKTSEKTPGFK